MYDYLDFPHDCNSMPLGAAWAYYMLGKSSHTG